MSLVCASDSNPCCRSVYSVSIICNGYSGGCGQEVYAVVCTQIGEGNGTPLKYSCLENPMDGGAW